MGKVIGEPIEIPIRLPAKQAQSSPLLQAKADHKQGIANIVAQRDEARKHAQALAEALREIKRETGESRDFRSAAMCASIAHKALAAWEGAQ